MYENGFKTDCSYIDVLIWRGNTIIEGIPDVCFFACTKAKYHLRLAEMHVAKQKQNNGYGTMMMNRIKTLAQEFDSRKITLRCHKENKSSITFWKKQGATITGTNQDDYEMEIIMSTKPIIDTSYSSPRWTGEIADCSLPVTFDTYSNCSFGCVYCFSQYQRGIGKQKEAYLSKQVKCVNIEKVKRIFTDPENNQFWEYVKNRRPIQWGGLSDQFDGYEKSMA